MCTSNGTGSVCYSTTGFEFLGQNLRLTELVQNQKVMRSSEGDCLVYPQTHCVFCCILAKVQERTVPGLKAPIVLQDCFFAIRAKKKS